jgi:hypothetical protein
MSEEFTEGQALKDRMLQCLAMAEARLAGDSEGQSALQEPADFREGTKMTDPGVLTHAWLDQLEVNNGLLSIFQLAGQFGWLPENWGTIVRAALEEIDWDEPDDEDGD